MLGPVLKAIDWFVPDALRRERSELGMARSYVFINLFGPLIAQPICVYLYMADPDPGPVAWTLIGGSWSFILAPFAFRRIGLIRPVALCSVQMLAFIALFGSFFYGGVSSPLMPWFVVALLLFFFYVGDRPRLVLGLAVLDLLAFAGAYEVNGGFGDRVRSEQLTAMGWASILAATVFMAFMAIYYVSTVGLRSDLEKEADRHRDTAVRLRRAKVLADRANLQRSIFLAKMSHEFRTPLNAVIGYSELLLEQGEDSGAADQKLEDLRRINAAGRRLLALVTDVLDLSRIEARSVDLTAGTFPVHELLADVTATAQPLIEANGNRLVVDAPAGSDEVTTDRTKLGQVLLNLLGNAGKFTRDGEVALRVRLERRPGGDWLEFAVEDTGIGMSDTEMSRLFQDFAQANAQTAGRYGGTGLGLSVSQKLCALMGGAISVQSQPGLGSTFTVRVPAALPADALAA